MQKFVKGCYYFNNTTNGKGYAGQSNNVYRRFNSHLTLGPNRSTALYPIHLALLKYGLINFTFSCFLLNAQCYTGDFSVILMVLEQFLFYNFNISYNVVKIADQVLLIKAIILVFLSSPIWFFCFFTFFPFFPLFFC
jgi:group I intron endonuclease